MDYEEAKKLIEQTGITRIEELGKEHFLSFGPVSGTAFPILKEEIRLYYLWTGLCILGLEGFLYISYVGARGDKKLFDCGVGLSCYFRDPHFGIMKKHD